jgi:hypothetical protein
MFDGCRRDGKSRRYCEYGSRYIARRMTDSDIRVVVKASRTKRKVPAYLARKLRAADRSGQLACARYR